MKRITENDLQSLTDALAHLENFVFLESSKVSENDHQSMLFIDPLDWLVCTAEDSVEEFFLDCESWRKKGKYLAGWIGYEFGYLLEPALRHFCGPHFRPSGAGNPLAVLGVFDQPVVFDHATNSFLNNKAWPAPSKIGEAGHKISNIQTNIGHEEYLSAINRVKEYISAGDTYQVNYTMKLKFDFSGSVADLYRTLRRNQSVSYGAWIRYDNQDVISLSPELFYRAGKENITVRPMKGTLGRGRTTAEDIDNRTFLQNDPKNRSENIMIVDLLRNDLGRLLYEVDGGRVQPKSLFDVETYETLFQMTSTIEGRLASGRQLGFQEVIKAIFPCGSITGAPKIRTMEIIHELEKEERGVYCGAIGYSSPEETVFNVPIRTVVLKNGRGEMGVGGAIIHDSDPEGEWQEGLLKGRFLTHPRPEFQLIETLLWQPESGYLLLEEHLQRLTDSASYFLFSFDEAEIRQALTAKAATFLTRQRVRLLLYRDGVIELTSTELQKSEVSDLFQPLVSAPLPVVSFSRQHTNPDSPYLYHKTTKRKIYDDGRKLAAELQLYEILFTNNRGEVTEGSISNIFIEKDGRFFTPSLSCGVLNGTLRRFLLNEGRAEERVLTRQDIDSADAVFVGNSVRGLVQVTVRAEDC